MVLMKVVALNRPQMMKLMTGELNTVLTAEDIGKNEISVVETLHF